MSERTNLVLSLAQLGYEPDFARALDALGLHLKPARVVGQHRREWDVHDGQEVRRAVLAGRRWDPARGAMSDEVQPTIGDWVALCAGSSQNTPVIEHVLPRKTWLTRSAVARRGQKQVIVANVDVIAIVAAFTKPDTTDAVSQRSLHPRRLERFLAAVRPGGALPVVVINKADLQPDRERLVRELEDRLAGVVVMAVSTLLPDGLEPLRGLLSPGKTIGFVGLSGVGKSSIVNRLLGGSVQHVAQERSSDARGRHTTTHRELFVTEEQFLLIDTPGLRELALADGDDSDLGAFEDITELSRECRFRDCKHEREPGCAVVAATKQGKLAADRLRSYQELATELRAKEGEAPAQRPHAREREARRGKRHNRPAGWDEEDN